MCSSVRARCLYEGQLGPGQELARWRKGSPGALQHHINSLCPDPAGDAANIGWTCQLSATMKPFTTGRVYANFIGDEGRDRMVASFGPEGYARLQALQNRYDPHNRSRSNQKSSRAERAMSLSQPHRPSHCYRWQDPWNGCHC
jgi:hypothetical protein